MSNLNRLELELDNVIIMISDLNSGIDLGYDSLVDLENEKAFLETEIRLLK